MRIKPVVSFLSVSLFLGACDPSVTPHEFAKHIENAENEYITQVTEGPFTFRLMYTPPEYLAVNYLHSDRIKKEDFERLTQGYAPFENYRLEIRSDDAKTIASFASYFSFHLQPQLKKVCGTDTVACSIYQAEPFHGMRHEQRIEIGFPKKACNREAHIVLTGTPLSPDPILIPVPAPTEHIPQIELY